MKKKQESLSPVAAPRLVRLFFSSRWREFRHAIRGKVRHSYRVVRRDGTMKVMSVGDVFATDIADAVRVINMKHSKRVIQGIAVSNRSVAIKLLVAYPCRLARWIFAYRGTRNLELQNVRAVLCLQTRQAVVKHVNPGVFIVDLAESPDATPDTTIPADSAKSALVFGDAVAVDNHCGGSIFLPNA